MRWTNYHCHNSFCDGRAEAEAFVLSAIEKDFEILGFSSHAPIPIATVWNMKEADFGNYFKRIAKLKKTYQDQIKIYTGLEVDYVPNLWNANVPLIKNADTDYLISSIHFLDGFENGDHWAIDGTEAYFENGFQLVFNNDPRKIVRRFTEIASQMIEANGFDIVGHLDKIYQHGHRFFNINDKWYRHEIHSLLSLAKEHDLIVEINTKSFKKLGFFYPHQSFFKVMNDLKLKITINSDTHDPWLMDTSYDVAKKLLQEAGFNSTFELIQGDWIDCPLN